MTATGVVSRKVDRLRAEFDRSFAEPVRSHDAEHVELLAVRCGGRDEEAARRSRRPAHAAGRPRTATTTSAATATSSSESATAASGSVSRCR